MWTASGGWSLAVSCRVRAPACAHELRRGSRSVKGSEGRGSRRVEGSEGRGSREVRVEGRGSRVEGYGPRGLWVKGRLRVEGQGLLVEG
eukprot:267062-Rhodomonas_salina.2